MRLLFIYLSVTLFFLLIPANNAICQTDMSNKVVVERFFEEVINKQRLDLLDELFAENYHAHHLVHGTESKGLDNLRSFLPDLFKAFPDIDYTIGDIITEGDKVAIRVYLSGTHRDEILGIPASNKRIENLSEIFFFRLKDGKIVEGWVQLDLYSLHKKLGVENQPGN